MEIGKTAILAWYASFFCSWVPEGASKKNRGEAGSG